MSITERLRARKVANVIEVEGDTPRIRGQMPDALCIEAADEIDRLSADLREEQDRRQAMSNQWRTEVEAFTDRIGEMQAAFRTLASAYPGAPLSRVELRTFAGMEP